MNDGLHKEYTGVSNKVILENLGKLLEMGKKVRVRMPMIPGVTFTEGNINETLAYLSGLPFPFEGVDLLPYHNTASHKYERFGMKNQFVNLKSVHKTELEDVGKRFEEAGFEVKIGG